MSISHLRTVPTENKAEELKNYLGSVKPRILILFVCLVVSNASNNDVIMTLKKNVQ